MLLLPDNAPPRILYVEDDANLRFVTADNLAERGYAVTGCADGATGLTAFEAQVFDLCLLDVLLLGPLDGFGLARRIRALNPQVPILFLSARALKEDRVAGLRLGADDYITKPFSLEELELRIQVFLRRRAGPVAAPPPAVPLGRFVFSLANLTLRGPAGTVQLTQREAQLLALFSQYPNQVLRRGDILRQLWGDDDYFLGRSLDVFVSRLRKHLRHDPGLALRNVPRVGFCLHVDPPALPDT